MKNLNDQVVIDTAKELIAKNGSTTTLDIKEELRNQGYFATQNQVSTSMFTNAIAAGLDFTVVYGHRDYVESIPTQAIPDPSATISVPDPCATLSVQSIDDAITLCEANGLLLLKQANGNLKFADPANKDDDFYTITANGYARRHYKNDSNRYQLNKKIFGDFNGSGTYQSCKRVLLPGQYVDLAEIVVRIAKKHR